MFEVFYDHKPKNSMIIPFVIMIDFKPYLIASI